MEKKILSKEQYTFVPLERKILLSNDVTEFNKEGLLLITNTTTNTIIYNFGCEGYGGTIGIFGKDIILEYDTTNMTSTDSLQIVLFTSETTQASTQDILEEIKRNTKVLHNITEYLTTQIELLKNMF